MSTIVLCVHDVIWVIDLLPAPNLIAWFLQWIRVGEMSKKFPALVWFVCWVRSICLVLSSSRLGCDYLSITSNNKMLESTQILASKVCVGFIFSNSSLNQRILVKSKKKFYAAQDRVNQHGKVELILTVFMTLILIQRHYCDMFIVVPIWKVLYQDHDFFWKQVSSS